MDHSAYIASTLISANQDQLSKLEELLETHFDHYPVELEVGHVEVDGSLSYLLVMEPGDVPMSMSSRVEAFCLDASAHVEIPFEVQLRTDEMNDDRDTFFYGGGSAQAQAAFAAQCRIKRAMECLAPEDELARDALKALLTEPATTECVEHSNFDRTQ